MNAINYRFSLDMFDTVSQRTIKAKKGDSACKINITLTKNGKVYNITEGCSATLSAKKADGNFVYNDCTIEGNTIVYDFASSLDDNGVCQVSACEGSVECEVTLYKDSKQLTGPRFTLVIDGTVYSGESIESSPSFDAFKGLIAQKMDKFGEVTLIPHPMPEVYPDEYIAEHLKLLAPFVYLQDIKGDNIARVERDIADKPSLEIFTPITFSETTKMEDVIINGGSIYGTPVSGLPTPTGIDLFQAANVEFVKKARDMRLLIDHTVTKDEVIANDGAGTAFEYNKDKDGISFNLDAFHIFVDIPQGLVKDVNLSVFFNGGSANWDLGKALFFMGANKGAYGTFWAYAEKIADDKWRCMSTNVNSVSTSRLVYSQFEMESVDLINSARVGGLLATGAKFKIWGRDAI